MHGGDKEVLDNDRSWQMYWGPRWREVQRLCLRHQVLRQRGFPAAPAGQLQPPNAERFRAEIRGKRVPSSDLMNQQQVWVNKQAST